MVDRVHARHHRRQHLRSADVGGGLFTADVLLACLQGEAVGRVAVHVHTYTDQPPRHGALELIAARQVRCVRAAIAQGHAKALRGADHDVGIPFSRGHQQCQRQQVRRDDEGCLLVVNLFNVRTQVVNASAGAGVLRQHGEIVRDQCGMPFWRRVGQHHRDAQRRGTGLNDLNRLRMAIACDDEGVGLAFHGSLGQCHGFGGCRGFIQHRGIGNRHAGQVTHHGLKVDQRLKATLRNFRLVRRVSRVPRRVFKNVAQDHAGCVVAIVALTNEAFEHLVFGGHCFKFSQCGGFGNGRWNRHGAAAGNRARHDAFDQFTARR